jgi:hypothetical protein
VRPLLAGEETKEQHRNDRCGKPANKNPPLPATLENDLHASRLFGRIRRRLSGRFTDHPVQRGTGGFVRYTLVIRLPRFRLDPSYADVVSTEHDTGQVTTVSRNGRPHATLPR